MHAVRTYGPGDLRVEDVLETGLVGEPLRYRADLLRLIGASRLDPGRIISHALPLTEAPEAYRMFDAREATKVVLQP